VTKAEIEEYFYSSMESPLSHTGPKTSQNQLLCKSIFAFGGADPKYRKVLQQYVVIFESNCPKDRPKTIIFLVKFLT